MGIISHKYIKDFVCRYDKQVGVPYYSVSDFANLKEEKYTFNNSKGIEIHYFFYYYDNYQEDKVILFLPGIGPGHCSYFAEINTLCQRGYKVLTLDYTGCGESKGKYLGSLNMPTRDVIDLLDLLKLKETIYLIGHSLGGYTALNVVNIREDIDKAVIISGFLDMKSLLDTFTKSNFITKHLLKYEKRINPEYYPINNIDYLKNTKDDIFFIQSIDDGMIPYRISLEVVESIENPNIKTLRLTNRKHNPNYEDDAIEYMNEVFGGYQRVLNNKSIKTDEDRINYFKDVSLERLTKQDEKIYDQIIGFIK